LYVCLLEELIRANAFIVSLLDLRSMHPAINTRPQFILRVSLCTDSNVVVERVKYKRCYWRLVSACAKNTNAVMCSNDLLWYNFSVPSWISVYGNAATQIWSLCWLVTKIVASVVVVVIVLTIYEMSASLTLLPLLLQHCAEALY